MEHHLDHQMHRVYAAAIKKVVVMLYKTAYEIKKSFACQDSTFYQTRKIIKKHPERYTPYAVIDRLVSAPCFMDARVYGKKLEAGESVPPFDLDKAVQMARGLFDD
jgi:hypothetical protein